LEHHLCESKQQRSEKSFSSRANFSILAARAVVVKNFAPIKEIEIDTEKLSDEQSSGGGGI
jgi:hypothetical protein